MNLQVYVPRRIEPVAQTQKRCYVMLEAFIRPEPSEFFPDDQDLSAETASLFTGARG
jgi:hypothetical protein